MYFELIKNNRIGYSLRVLRTKHLYQKERQFLNQRDYNFKVKLEKEEQIKSKQAGKKKQIIKFWAEIKETEKQMGKRQSIKSKAVF